MKMKKATKINKLNEMAANRKLGLLLVKTGVKAGTGFERPMRQALPVFEMSEG
jgi:hypothetical protein